MARLNSSEAEETFKNKHVKRASDHRAVKNNEQTKSRVHQRIVMSVVLCILVVVIPSTTASQGLDISVNKPAKNASEVRPWVNFSPGNLSLRPINNYLCMLIHQRQVRWTALGLFMQYSKCEKRWTLCQFISSNFNYDALWYLVVARISFERNDLIWKTGNSDGN